MLTESDDLDKLLSAVRKTIHDNQQFLQGLVDETVEECTELENVEENREEEFEEL